MNTESFFEKANCRGYHGKDSSKFSGRCNYLSDSSLGAVGKKQVQQPAEIMNIVGRYCPGNALKNVNFLKKGIDQNFYYCISVGYPKISYYVEPARGSSLRRSSCVSRIWLRDSFNRVFSSLSIQAANILPCCMLACSGRPIGPR